VEIQASATLVDVEGVQEIFSGGAGTSTTVQSGGIEKVYSRGTASGTVVSRGGTLAVLSGGLADPATIYSGGTEIVSASGTDLGAQISGGEQDLFGYASGASVFTGSQVVESGGTASGTIVGSGGTEFVYSGGSAAGTTVDSGGSQTIYSGGSATDLAMNGSATISGGTLELLSGVSGESAGATTYQYNVNLTLESESVSGSILTDSNSGTLSQTDIVGWSLIYTFQENDAVTVFGLGDEGGNFILSEQV
jgi:autotransporter passenger strand-loop-strand repeat protein